MTEEDWDAVDPWLTLAEIAEELRVNPATVRQWVSRGQLKASRAGMRKWIVRRSDLESMLAATSPRHLDDGDGSSAASEFRGRRADAGARSKPDAPHAAAGARHDNAAELLQYAANALDDALDASRYAPPSPGYVDRLRTIADAFERFAVATLHASRTAGMRWSGRAKFAPDYLPYELQPGRNRPRLDGLWDEFDAAVETLSIATTGHDMDALAGSFRAVADALRVVVNELERDERWQAGHGGA